MKTQISIIGCGWLGKPLAINLTNVGYTVKGSTTSKQKLGVLEKNGIIPYLIGLNETHITGDITGFLNGSETLIINIPPRLRNYPHKNHVLEIERLLSAVEQSSIKHILYVSSTSVFEDRSNIPVILLNDEPKVSLETTNQLVTIEQVLKKQRQLKTTIVRFGGLFGEDRHPGNFLSGKVNIKNPKAPINLIHQKDCVDVITKIITSHFWDKTLNVAYPFHPNKKEYYTKYCKLNAITIPQFNINKSSKGKYIDSSKISTILDFSFSHKP